MRVFLTGATGYVGTAIAQSLLKGEHQLTALARSLEKGEYLRKLGAKILLGNLRQPEVFWEPILEHDVLIHAGAESVTEWHDIEKKFLELILDRLKKSISPKMLIYTSGVWVLGNTGDKPADENASTAHPAEIVAWRPAHEKLVLEFAGKNLMTAVVRPGIVFGGNRGICAAFFESAEKEGAATYIGHGKNRWTMVYRHDLANLYRMIAEKKASGIFHGVDEVPLPVEEIARSASKAVGKNGATKNIPLEEARKKFGPFADALALDQVIKASHARELGWKPLHPPFAESAPALYQEFKKTFEVAVNRSLP
jgi:nucleoside-diphosphate-sugar epimerase